MPSRTASAPRYDDPYGSDDGQDYVQSVPSRRQSNASQGAGDRRSAHTAYDSEADFPSDDPDATNGRWPMSKSKKHHYRELAKGEEKANAASVRSGAAATPPRRPRKGLYIAAAVLVLFIIIGVILGFLWHNGILDKIGKDLSDAGHSLNSTASDELQQSLTATSKTSTPFSNTGMSMSLSLATSAAVSIATSASASASASATSISAGTSSSVDWSSFESPPLMSQSISMSPSAATAPSTIATTTTASAQSDGGWFDWDGPTYGGEQTVSSDAMMSVQTVPNPVETAAATTRSKAQTAGQGQPTGGIVWSDSSDSRPPAAQSWSQNTDTPWNNSLPGYGATQQQSGPPTSTPWSGQQGNQHGALAGQSQQPGQWQQQQQPSQQPGGQWQQQQEPQSQSGQRQQQQQQPAPDAGQWQQQSQQGGQGGSVSAAGAFAWQTFAGPATWYEADQHFGQCGVAVKNEDFVVSLSQGYFSSFGDRSEVCMQETTISNTDNGATVNAWIVDSCAYCTGSEYAIDVSKSVFAALNNGDFDKGVLRVVWGFTKQNDTSTAPAHDVVGQTPTGLASITSGSGQAAKPTSTTTPSSTDGTKESDGGWRWPWQGGDD